MATTNISSPARKTSITLFEALQLLDNFVRSSAVQSQYHLDETSSIVRDVLVRSAIRRATRGIRPHKDQLPLPQMNE
jgi:hypothetical protein